MTFKEWLQNEENRGGNRYTKPSAFLHNAMSRAFNTFKFKNPFKKNVFKGIKK
jgi:hypothetical protein